MRLTAPWGRRRASILWRLVRPTLRVQPALPSCYRPQYDDPVNSRSLLVAPAIQRRAFAASTSPTIDQHYARWVRQYDPLLPPDLRSRGTRVGKEEPAVFDINTFLNLAKARKDLKPDALAWMVNNGRRKAALSLIYDAQKYIAAHKLSPAADPPSNLDWPQDLFTTITKEHVHVNGCKPTSVSPPTTHSGPGLDDFVSSDSHKLALVAEGLIWQNIAFLILSALDHPQDSPGATQSMSAALLAMGSFHNLGLMPENVYSKPQQQHPAFIRKAPVLYLLSSHILSALSDAAWREQQDDAIANARRKGQTLDEIARSVPGGRFRLKIPPLAPEIWLELVLSACLELGHAVAARRLVALLIEDREQPWRTSAWCDLNHDQQAVDQHSRDVSARRKPHSLDRPAIAVPARTVSVEIILALIDDLVNNVRVDYDPAPKHTFRLQIINLLILLAPHALPPSYFDYLQTRLLHLGAFDDNRNPFGMQSWFALVDSMRLLDRVDEIKNSQQSLSLDSIKVNSLLPLALHHQAMHAFIQVRAVHNALASFNNIQEWIDKNKFTSVMKFLQAQQQNHNGFFNSQSFPNRLEFADSNGQIPEPILAAFLNLISDNKIPGLGQWLVDSDDVDGALIPASIHKHPTMAAALYKFSAASNDPLFFDTLRFRRVVAKNRPTVRMLRAEIDAAIDLEEFDVARTTLRVLRRVQGGGIGLNNIASIGAKIIQLEANASTGRRTLSLAKWLLREALDGTYDCVRDDYTTHQRALYKQRISHLLRIFVASNSPSLRQHALKYAPNFIGGNLASLPPAPFNKILSAVVAHQGSDAGKWLWEIFCDETGFNNTYKAPNIVDEGDDRTQLAGSRSPEEDIFIEDSVYTDYERVILESSSNQSANSNLDSNNHHANEAFVNPYFDSTKADLKGLSNNQLSKLEVEAFENQTPDTWGAETHSLLDPQVVTKPDLQTLRIIVRAAIEEKRVADGGAAFRRANQLLGWARQWYHKMGITHKEILEEEFEDSYVENTNDEPGLRFEESNTRPSSNDGGQERVPRLQPRAQDSSDVFVGPKREGEAWQSFADDRGGKQTPGAEQTFEPLIARDHVDGKPASALLPKPRYPSKTRNPSGETSQRWVPRVSRGQTVVRSSRKEQRARQSRQTPDK